MVQLFNQLFFQPESTEAPAATAETIDASPERVAAKILEELLQLNQAKNSTLVLIYLPGQNFTGVDLTHWRQAVKTSAEKQGALFIDMVDEFKNLPPDELSQMFIQEGEIAYRGAAGHYTAKGNQYVADRLYEILMALPEVRAKFESR